MPFAFHPEQTHTEDWDTVARNCSELVAAREANNNAKKTPLLEGYFQNEHSMLDDSVDEIVQRYLTDPMDMGM